jgi:hypothetical protein
MVSNFAWLMLAGFRVLLEGQPLNEEYQKFGYVLCNSLIRFTSDKKTQLRLANSSILSTIIRVFFVSVGW